VINLHPQLEGDQFCCVPSSQACTLTTHAPHRLTQVGGEISLMAEALDPDLMQPRTEAERKLVQQLQEGHARQQERTAALHATPMDTAPMDTDTAAAAAAAAAQGSEVSTSAGEQHGGSSGSCAAAGSDQTRWGRCFYTRLPRLVKAPGAQGAELTALNLDKTAALEQVAAAGGDSSGKRLLGELQFAYLAFLLGQSLEGVLMLGVELSLLLVFGVFMIDPAVTARLDDPPHTT